MSGPKFTVIQGGGVKQERAEKHEATDVLEMLGIDVDFTDRSPENVMTITVLIAALTAAMQNENYVSVACVMRDQGCDTYGDHDYAYAFFNTETNLVQTMGAIELMKLRLQEVWINNTDYGPAEV